MVFAQRLVALLESGRRVSTYKLATVTAIVDVCLENSAADDETLAIPVQELAHRVVAYYWPQVRPYLEHGRLSQNEQSGQSIPVQVALTRDQLIIKRIRTAEGAREREDPDYLRLVRRVELTLAQQPLTHLQTTPARGAVLGRQDFIFDATGLHKKMTRAELDAHGPVVLRPGAARSFRELAPLLKPMIEMLWVADVVQLNRSYLETDDIAGFLFGVDRTALTGLTPHLRDLQNNRCFYCDKPLPGAAHVDHVLPWSKIPIDGVANLVLADPRCNLAKLASLPVVEHVTRATSRSKADLDETARRSRLPVLLERTRRAASGIYGTLPAGSPLWQAPGHYEPHT